MLACKAGADCQPPSHAPQYHHPFIQHTGLTTTLANLSPLHSKGGGHPHLPPKCGSDFAYLYFCSFVFLSSFLVSRILMNRKSIE
jgi:hypothetical protein